MKLEKPNVGFFKPWEDSCIKKEVVKPPLMQSILEEYCWQVAPQQSLLPLPLLKYKVN